MTYGELLEFLYERGLNSPSFLQDSVTVYDRTKGEYYPCDTIEFEEDDEIIDPGYIFLQIER